MKSFRILLGAAAALTLLTITSPSLQAAHEFTSAGAMAAPVNTQPAAAPSVSGFSGVSAPFIAAGLPVSGFLPCFGQYCSPSIPGVEEVNIPLAVLTRGSSYQFYFPVQTTYFDGDLEAVVSITDSAGVNNVILQGEIGLFPQEINIYYGTATTLVPTTAASGKATLILTFFKGTNMVNVTSSPIDLM